MGWYYYSGNVVKSIPVSRTKSVAVRPNSKIEILEVTQEAQTMLSMGILKRTGKPLGATSMEDAPPRPKVHLRDVLPPSGLAMHFAEKGVTSSEALPPRKPVGAPEFTVHELAAREAPVVAPEGSGDAAVLPDDAAEDNESGKSKRRRGH
jgi:hypothetical protein